MSILSGTGLTVAVSDEVTVQRIQTVTTFLRAGVPLAKLKLLRPLIENNNFHLTDSTHLVQYIPFVLQTEKERIGKEIKEAEFVSTIFDGSTRQGEALAVLICFISPEFEKKQFLAGAYRGGGGGGSRGFGRTPFLVELVTKKNT